MEGLRDIGEHEAIRRLTAILDRHHPDLIVGAGDDCAVARLPGTDLDQVFTTDPVIEGVHFMPGEDPTRIGNKAAGRVLSDMAAMGASPQWMLVNVVAPPELEVSRIEAIYQGMNACCSHFGTSIIGGDLAEGKQLELHVFGTGILPSGSALLRSGARLGDSIYVTGPLGGSRAGKHLDFRPRVEEGTLLRESGFIHAAMDISDGLATDLRHIMKQSGVGAQLDADDIPKTGTLEQALYDGEDFELLFTMSPESEERLLSDWNGRFQDRPVCIGQITKDAGVLRVCHSDGSVHHLESKAYEHFRARRKR